MNQLVDMTGKRFGRLTVIGIGGCTKEPSGRSRPLWKCICDCGNEVLVLRDNLIHGRTQSCGCFHLEQKYKAHKNITFMNLMEIYARESCQILMSILL